MFIGMGAKDAQMNVKTFRSHVYSDATLHRHIPETLAQKIRVSESAAPRHTRRQFSLLVLSKTARCLSSADSSPYSPSQ